MFIQVIEGKVADAAALRRQFDLWLSDLAPRAEGWLGTTGGYTDDGGFIAAARFESEEAARRNSERPEQGQWFAETEKHFAGPVDFKDYPNVELFLDGGSDDAGFVQMIQGRARDLNRLVAISKEFEPLLRQNRPDVIGGTLAWASDGDFTETVYFSSEAEAREGEQRRPPEGQELFDEWLSLIEGIRYVDLHEPMMWSP